MPKRPIAEAPSPKLAALPYTLSVEEEESVIGRHGVATMSAGHLHHLSRSAASEVSSLHEATDNCSLPLDGAGPGWG